MIAETGHFALILALATALVQFAVPLYGAAKGDRILMNVAAPAALAQLSLIVIAFLALLIAHRLAVTVGLVEPNAIEGYA